jgi:protein SCO1/2
MTVKVWYALVALVFAVAACSSSGGDPGGGMSTGLVVQPKVGSFQGFGLIPPQPRPSFTLTDTDGKKYAFQQQTDGRATLLFFGYTRCPDICPETMADIGVALRKLPASVSQKVTVVFVSTDVKHDTGPVLKRWIANFSPNTHASFVGLRGTQAQVDSAQAGSHIMIAEDGGRTHSTQVLLFGPDNYAHDSFIFNDQHESAQMEHDLPLVVNGKT